MILKYVKLVEADFFHIYIKLLRLKLYSEDLYTNNIIWRKLNIHNSTKRKKSIFQVISFWLPILLKKNTYL